MLWPTLLYAAIVWSLWKALGLLLNIRIVRRLGLPIVMQICDPHPILLISRWLCKRALEAFSWKGRVRPESANLTSMVK